MGKINTTVVSLIMVLALLLSACQTSTSSGADSPEKQIEEAPKSPNASGERRTEDAGLPETEQDYPVQDEDGQDEVSREDDQESAKEKVEVQVVRAEDVKYLGGNIVAALYFTDFEGDPIEPEGRVEVLVRKQSDLQDKPVFSSEITVSQSPLEFSAETELARGEYVLDIYYYYSGRVYNSLSPSFTVKKR